MILNNFNNLDVKKKINYVVGITCLAVILIIYFAILPFINDIKKLRADLITEKIELADKMNKDKNMVDLNDNIKKIEPQLQILDKIFINKNRELDFITILELIEKKNFVSQKLVINPLNESDKNIIKTVPVNIEVVGQYKNALQYLSDLEALSYYVNINTIDISKAENTNLTTEGKTNNENIKLSISANTFWK
ncbi:MAG: hypothetical protein US83_C0002G0091 [Candidatus Falkowbacteria bacterium GW2011_GWC2_38_22]|uniref:Pilus assembly protein, PilO n=1 Tax=Candidatus Falkowbacteria bacterium GW2011_GWE1_38_31 TaxID=1618638 RepID=A0A0G0N0S0_9BACT|nr:MAG: hypothetical protein US73_C0007G0091 [Candidatus Falkowbacteria bacterium GW2011_GWF2_38_1205]KKQ62002.1 MAG: hypothetical protein US83_C0002G0091 [Candidatus Falkowbacteria bacterium GW2011_GWC2_38_22]KKQ63836.1 MAG: hypothetical protein US84_C0003G0026 [Candidatus Falkowbacteria bacterium GW2011_GWF1_38_22]KKQ66093.1 MAG: hypothetical protein US87_C0003G0026 [Candidatus Falkowbacteria bacterium GW2011_GWE2_38_254]KKQ70696.1 MAG: hypothetical protein US91_C0003G0026 [Candidatus Falkowb